MGTSTSSNKGSVSEPVGWLEALLSSGEWPGRHSSQPGDCDIERYVPPGESNRDLICIAGHCQIRGLPVACGGDELR